MVLRMVLSSVAEHSSLIINGTRLIGSQTQVGYYGNSQGGILGGAYLALSTQLTRGVLGTLVHTH
jgi:cephalosporin-C deacetylase-like acetyl esterase